MNSTQIWMPVNYHTEFYCLNLEAKNENVSPVSANDKNHSSIFYRVSRGERYESGSFTDAGIFVDLKIVRFADFQKAQYLAVGLEFFLRHDVINFDFRKGIKMYAENVITPYEFGSANGIFYAHGK